MLAVTLQRAGLYAVSCCEIPPIGFQMSWMTLGRLPLSRPLIPENV